MTREPTEMETKVALVILANAAAWQGHPNERALVQARAAIRAMREPTDAMQREGLKYEPDPSQPLPDNRWAVERIILNGAYGAMIDAASPP